MKNLIVAISITFGTFSAMAQTENKEIKKLKFGFNVGTNYSFLNAKSALPNNASIYNGMGAKMGILMNYALSKNILISPKTELAFNRAGVVSLGLDNSKSTYEIFPISLELMTHFVYLIGEKSSKPYILLGPNFRLPLDNKMKTSTTFKNKSDLAIDFGIGLQNSLKHFVFSPEIRYSLGFMNVNANPSFQEITYHNLSLVFNFN